MFGFRAKKKSARNPNSLRRIHSESLLFCCVLVIETPGRHNLLVPVTNGAVITSEVVISIAFLKIENNFKSHYFACFGLLSTSTFVQTKVITTQGRGNFMSMFYVTSVNITRLRNSRNIKTEVD